MQITRKSMATGIKRTLELDITQAEIDAYNNDPHLMIQNAFPQLNADEREFFMTGMTSEEWDAAFPPEDDSEDPDSMAAPF